MYPAHRELSGLVVGDLVLDLVMGMGMGLVVGMVVLVQGMVGLVPVMVLPCCNRDLQVDMVRLVMGMVMGSVRFHSYLVKYMIITVLFANY